MNMIFDLVLLAIFILEIIISTIRGFIRSVWSTVTLVIAVAISYAWGPGLGDWICMKLIFPNLTDRIVGIIEGCIHAAESSSNVSDFFEFLHDGFIMIAEICGINLIQLSDQFVSDPLITPERIQALAESFALPVSKTISNTIGIILLFFISFLVLFLFGLVLKLIVKIPSLRKMDGTLGFVLGIIKGVVLVSMLCFITALFIESAVVNSTIGLFLKNLTDDSYIFSFFCELFPVNFINID